MHAIFIPYGDRRQIEKLYNAFESQQFMLPLINEKGQDAKFTVIGGSIRFLPFGAVEFIFPKGYKDSILSTLEFNKKDCRYRVPEIIIKLARKFLRCKKADYQESPRYKWDYESIEIIPIGLREDRTDLPMIDEHFKGWTQEAL